MPDQKITELTELTSGQIADTDVLPIVDVDADATKKWTWASLKADILSWIGAVTATFTNKTIDADNNTITNIGTSELSDEGVTLAKMAHIATNRILGRETAGTGDVEALTATQVRTIINVENGADVTDTANVTASGALMDSEVTDLAGIKALQTSTLQLKPAEGAFVDGDKTKLDGIETGADVTDAANVISALNGAAITVGVVTTTDKLLWQDADDSDALKYSTVQSILDLGSSFDTSSNYTVTGDWIFSPSTPPASILGGSLAAKFVTGSLPAIELHDTTNTNAFFLQAYNGNYYLGYSDNGTSFSGYVYQTRFSATKMRTRFGGGAAGAILEVIGEGTTSATSAFKALNSSSASLFEVKNNGVISIPLVPTSSAGLSAGDVWSDGGTLKVV